MKNMLLPIVLFVMTAAVIPAQEVDLHLAVTTQEMDREMLRDLGLNDGEIEEITALQEQFRQMRMETLLERNVIKARLARELHNSDADEGEINRMLERASELRLEQEQAQVRSYLRIREMLGEENWSELVRRIRVQARVEQRLRNDDPAGPQGSRSVGSRGSGSDPGGYGGNGGAGGSGSGNSDRN